MSEKDSITYFFLFHTIHDVLKAENALKGQDTVFELVPVPRALSSDCGVCIAAQRPSDKIIVLLLSINLDTCFSFNGREYSRIDIAALRSCSTQE